MLTLRKVAITGGLSSGKSSVCQIFQELGAYIVSADEIVHRLLAPQSPVSEKIIELLGQEIVDGTRFNREKIANKVFKNKELLKALEQILHPAVLDEVESQYKQVANKNFPLFVAEIPLLYEIESQHLFDTVVVVTADTSLCKKRFLEKTNHSTQEFEARMTHQLPLSEKQANADYTIVNNGTWKDLKTQTQTLFQQLTK